MTKLYFVRHAQPEHDHADDRTRPLTKEGLNDANVVVEFFKDKQIDAFYCSPYKRSVDTIAAAAKLSEKEFIQMKGFVSVRKDRKEIIMECFRSAGQTTLIMRRAASL